MQINETLKERGKRYGEFRYHADITQRLKQEMRDSPNWEQLPFDIKESLEMIQHKIGRVLNGDFTYSDNFIDIAGYATLISTRLLDEEIKRDFPDELDLDELDLEDALES